ncbi:MAG: glycoside hydrolase family 2 TIM barrel-domain containing protein [Pyrinomonadaceae bacterium]
MEMPRFTVTIIFVVGLFAVSVFSQTSAKRIGGERIVRSLNAGWKFSADDKPGFEGADVLDDSWQKINLPHTWNDKDTFDDEPGYRRGASWYRRELPLGVALTGKRLYLYFEGANQVADVYVNTNHVGKHIGGYTAFAYDITDEITLTKSNFIAVRVDNSFNADIAPLSGDFNMYGGIYRDVWLIAADDVHFKIDDMASSGLQISTPDLDDKAGKVRVRGTVSNTGRKAVYIEVASRILDAKGREVISSISKLTVDSKSEKAFDHTTNSIPNPHLWSPDDPYLYSIQNIIRQNGKIVDLKTEPLGFRWFRFDANNGFFLNGKHLKLQGTNRHQDYQGLGNAVPDRLHIRDMELMKDAGYNFVRLAHYPQDPSVLQAADRLGLMLWEEIPLVNYITESKAFTDNAASMLREMICQHRNHPSMILWGYMNEIFLHPPNVPKSVFAATVELARELDAIARAEDPTRLTTIAFHGNEVYNTYGMGEIPQVVGWNLYKGWYGGNIEEFGTFMDEQHKKFPNRVHFISEYGANGDQRLHSASPRRFDSTTEYQRQFHESYLKQINDRSYIAGSTIWNQFDFGAEQRGETIPHLNQKGMYTYDRVPKDIHFFYKSNFSKDAVLHIAANDRKYFSGVPNTEQTIDVYLNLPEAELFLNGVPLGKKTNTGNNRVSWTLKLRDGLNKLVATGRRNGRVVTDSATVKFTSITVNSKDIAINVGSNADFTDQNNLIWLADKPYSPGSWGFVGPKSKFIFSQSPDKNILGTPNDPLFQTMQEGLTGYRFDVPNGTYEVSLLFAETKFDEAGKRIFDISVNGKVLAERLDIAAKVGRNRAFAIREEVIASNGLNFQLISKIGDPVLSGIRIKRLTK